MILFQISLSGHMMRFLVALETQEREGVEFPSSLYDLPNLVSTFHALQREKLATHERPIQDEAWSSQNPPYKFITKGRRFCYEITDKGRLALQLAAMDLQTFLDEVRHEARALPAPRNTQRAMYRARIERHAIQKAQRKVERRKATRR